MSDQDRLQEEIQEEEEFVGEDGGDSYEQDFN